MPKKSAAKAKNEKQGVYIMAKVQCSSTRLICKLVTGDIIQAMRRNSLDEDWILIYLLSIHYKVCFGQMGTPWGVDSSIETYMTYVVTKK